MRSVLLIQAIYYFLLIASVEYASAASFATLGTLMGSPSSEAFAISADGLTVVGESVRPFRWDAANGMQELGDLPGGGSSGEALSVSSDDSTIVGRSFSLGSRSISLDRRWWDARIERLARR